MTPEQHIYLGNRGKEVLENEAYLAAIEKIKQEYTNAWMKSPVRDAEGREKLFLMIKTVEKLEATLNELLENGKMASKALEQEAAYEASQRAYGIQIG